MSYDLESDCFGGDINYDHDYEDEDDCDCEDCDDCEEREYQSLLARELSAARSALDCDYDGEEDFADPGGRSALRVGVRNLPCPTCGQPNRLTAADVRHGYQCDECADRAEGWGG